MKIENDNFVITWSEKSDENLARDILDKLNNKTNQFSEFFDLKKIPQKVTIQIYDNYESFKNYVVERMGSCEKYVCAYAGKGGIHLLNIECCRVNTTHKNIAESDVVASIEHELAHIYFDSFLEEQNPGVECPIFIHEGIATQLAEQKYYQRDKILCKASDLLTNFYNKKGNYANAYTLMGYMMKKYPHNELLDILSWKNPLSEKILDGLIVEANEYLEEN